ncbi:MAG: hypothetical protein WDN47_02345 [Candidatus Doudnabacteria bacterium]
MLAFVSAPAAPLTRTPVRLTLEEEVEAAGLRVIPIDRVRAFQARIKREWEAMDISYRGDWEKVPDVQITALQPPADIVSDIARASEIPRSQVHAERFKYDPFVFITRRKRGRATEVVCFAYWNAPGFVP